MTIEEENRAAADDRAWFAGNPDRQFRMRRAYSGETTSRPPAGYALFAVLHRNCVGNSADHEFFVRRRDFRVAASDAEIWKFLC